MFNAVERQKYASLGEMEYMDECWRDVREFIRANPGTFAVQSARRALYVWTGIWSLRPSYLRKYAQDLYDILPFTLMTVLALGGLQLAFSQRNAESWLFAAFLFGQPLPYYISHVQPRYRHALDPALLILASYAIIERWRHAREGRPIAHTQNDGGD
jgi:hypothetical protein